VGTRTTSAKGELGSATPSEAPKATTASKASVDTPGAACGSGFRFTAEDRCTPIDPQTGNPYSSARLAEFDAIRSSAFVAHDNFLVPRSMTPAEAEKRRELFAKANELGKKIEAGSATEEEIEDFFGFRARMRGYREQLLTYEHARTGGRVSNWDPVLDREEIESPEILARYEELERSMREEYAQKLQARSNLGLGE
jgi:hypothetical protein